MNLALNNLQRLICHKTQQAKQPKNKEKCNLEVNFNSPEFQEAEIFRLTAYFLFILHFLFSFLSLNFNNISTFVDYSLPKSFS